MLSSEEKKKKFNGKLVYLIIGVAILIVTVAGSTYAYFTARVTTPENTITGSALDIKLGVTASLVSKGTGKLIPIYDGSVAEHETQLTTAVSTASDCVDKNKNTVCQVYEIKVVVLMKLLLILL